MLHYRELGYAGRFGISNLQANPLSRTGVVRIPVCYLSIQKQESYEWEASLGYIVR